MRIPVLFGAFLSVVLCSGGVATSCSDDCDSAPECFAPGLLVGLPAEPTIAAVVICVDGECTTNKVVGQGQPSFTFADHGLNWRDGVAVDISLTANDQAGNEVAVLEERREMFDPKCTCAGFLYRFDGAEFIRSG